MTVSMVPGHLMQMDVVGARCLWSLESVVPDHLMLVDVVGARCLWSLSLGSSVVDAAVLVAVGVVALALHVYQLVARTDSRISDQEGR